MLIFQKNFNSPVGGSWLNPQFLVNGESSQQNQQSAPNTNTVFNSSYNPEVLNSSMPGLDGITRRALYRNEQAAQNNRLQQRYQTEAQNIANNGIRTTNPAAVVVDENVPIIEGQEESLPNTNNQGQTNNTTTTQGGTNTSNISATSDTGNSVAVNTTQEGTDIAASGNNLVNNFKTIKENAAQKFGEISSKYGTGISGSLAGDIGLAAGGLVLAGGAYNLIKKRKEKKKREQEALNNRIKR